MTEHLSHNPENPDTGQTTIDHLNTTVDTILAYKDPKSPFNFLHFPVLVDPRQLKADLAATRAGSLLLQPGEAFGIEDGGDYYPPLLMQVGEVEPTQAHLTASHQTFSDGSWFSSLEATMTYYGDQEHAAEKIIVEASNHSSRPQIFRKLYSMAYAETGYEGHGYKELEDATPEDAEEVMGVIVPLVMDVVAKVEARKAEAEAARPPSPKQQSNE